VLGNNCYVLLDPHVCIDYGGKMLSHAVLPKSLMVIYTQQWFAALAFMHRFTLLGKTKLLTDAPFIPNPETLTYHQLI